MIIPRHVKVENEPGLIRDTSNNAILATDLKQKESFINNQQKEMYIKNLPEYFKKTENMQQELQEIKTHVNDIKDMVKLLLNNSSQ